MKFETVPFGDLLKEPIRNGLTKPKAIRGSGVKMIAMGEIFSHARIGNITMDLVPVTEKEYNNCSILKGDLLFARQSLVLDGAGKCSIVTDVSEATVFESHLIRARVDPKTTDSYFLFYYFNSPHGKGNIKTIVEQVAAAGIRGSDLIKLYVPCPDIRVQKMIASVLNLIDKKIELNNKINENLEQQAQAVFMKCCAEPETIPDNWRKGSLLDIADYLNGLAMQKYRPEDGDPGLPVLKIKELRQQYCDDSSEKCSSHIKPEYVIHDGDVVFSWSGSLLVDLWCGDTCGLNQHLFKVTSEKYDKWFYYLWTRFHLNRFIEIAADKATTMGHIKRGELAKAEVLIPSDGDYCKIDAVLQPMLDLIISNRIENRKLASLRDTLLPKLMNGEIDVEGSEL